MALQRRPRVLRVAERPAFEAGERRGRDFTADKVVFLAHWSDAPRVTRSVSRLVEQFAVFLPAVKGWQRVKLAFDGPIGTNHNIRATHQPNSHDPLQKVRPL